MRKIFINSNSQVRSGWKIIITLAASCIMIFTSVITVSLICMILSKVIPPPFLTAISKVSTSKVGIQFAINILTEASMIFSVILFWRLFDKKPLSGMGLISLRYGYKDLRTGLILGIISMSLVFVIILKMGNVILEKELLKPTTLFPLFTGFILFIVAGISEELFSRGYCIEVLKQTGKTSIAVLVSSLVFTALHLGNKNISFLAIFNVFLAGILFSNMYLKTGSIWLSTGYHIMWNFFEGTIFGFQVSGLYVNGLYKVKNVTNNYINGGQFGPEGGIVVTIIITLGFLYLWKFYKPGNSNLQG